MSILTEEQFDIFVNDSDNYDDFMNIFHSHSYERVCNNEEDSDSEIELALDSNVKEVEKLEGRNDAQYEKESENKLKRRENYGIIC